MLLFAMAGLGSALSYFAALYLAESVVGLHYRIAVTVAYITSVMTHYLLNRYLTFAESSGDSLHGQLARYVVLVGMNYLINLAIVVACVELLDWPSAAGVLLSMPVTLAAGYLLARHWVFSPSGKKG